MIVVSDTGPLSYLAVIGSIDKLPLLFGQVIIPFAVAEELEHAKSPPEVRSLVHELPECLVIEEATAAESALADLGLGEQEAISLAQRLKAGLLLCDDRDARPAAQSRNIHVVGTLGVPVEAAQRRMLDLPDALRRLRRTNFRITEALVQQVLREHGEPPA